MRGNTLCPFGASHTMRVGNVEKQRSHDIGLIWHHQTYTFKETPEINDTVCYYNIPFCHISIKNKL